MSRLVRGALVASTVVLVTAFSCQPVTPSEPWDDWDFEGFQVYSHVPDDPVGLVYFFHGSYGSAEFATKIETTDVVNELVARGYGFVATESTLRTGNKRWDVSDPSLVTNPDLARLGRLHAEMIATTDVDADTPILGVGTSNGARMVTLFGQSFADAGHPVAAVAPYNGRVAGPVTAAGGLTVPTFFVISENDDVAPNALIQLEYAATVANGTPAELTTKDEEPLLAARFTRIPAIDEAEAEALRQALQATGVWNAAGQRLVPIADAVPILEAMALPPEAVGSGQAFRNQVQALLALHQFTGLHRVALADFFAAHLP